MQALEQLEQSLHALIEEHDRLLAELRTLREKEENQRQELVRTHSELNDLQQKYRALLTAHHLLGGEADRQKAKEQIGLILTQVNRAMEALKS